MPTDDVKGKSEESSGFFINGSTQRHTDTGGKEFAEVIL